MAIIIPSSKTYNRENPKIRDNVIDRIEVGGVEVTPYNEYNEVVYSGELLTFTQSTNITPDSNLNWWDGSGFDRGAVGSTIIDTYRFFDVKIQRNNNNSYISKLISNKEEGNGINLNKYIEEKAIYYQVENGFQVNNIGDNSINFLFDNFKDENQNATDLYDKKTINGFESIFVEFNANNTQNIVGFAPNWEIPSVQEKGNGQNKTLRTLLNYLIDGGGNIQVGGFPEGEQNLEIEESDLQNLEIEENEEYFTIKNIKILVERNIYSCASAFTFNPPFVDGTIYPAKVVKITQKSLKNEITVYGNTIGIDLTDKTLYIPEDDTASKKVHSFDGNELMQTANYFVDNGEKSIKTMYKNTKDLYALGKETATIRCSISDYYDYNSGDKVISIDNSTGKMSFKMYDQVIPMVYGADGQDRPISTYQDGSAKVFQVLGSKIYYDGAVWQELSLQEV